MGLLGLIEENDRVGVVLDGFGQITALVILVLARRCSDKAGNGRRRLVLTHVYADHVVSVAEHDVGQLLNQLSIVRDHPVLQLIQVLSVVDHDAVHLLVLVDHLDGVDRDPSRLLLAVRQQTDELLPLVLNSEES